MSNQVIGSVLQLPDEVEQQNQALISVTYPGGIAQAVFNMALFNYGIADPNQINGLKIGSAEANGDLGATMQCSTMATSFFNDGIRYQIQTVIEISQPQNLNDKTIFPDLMPVNDKDGKIIYYEYSDSAHEHSFNLIPLESQDGIKRFQIGFSSHNPEDPFQYSKYNGLQSLSNEIVLASKVHAKLIGGIATIFGFNPSELSHDWDQDKIRKPVWVNAIRAGNLNELPIQDLNMEILNLIDVGRQGDYQFDIISENGLVPAVKTFLLEIENKFKDISSIFGMSKQESALFCVGIYLKSLDQASHSQYSKKFVPNSNPSIGGIKWSRYGESRRDRLEFIKQQHDKYAYRPELNEIAYFALMHVLDKSGQFTYYEVQQSRNLISAERWEPKNPKLICFDDLVNLNKIILMDLVPDRSLGQVRNRSIEIGDREMIPEPAQIGYEMKKLANKVNEVDKMEYNTQNLKTVLELWLKFDNIHPFEEGNGRTGTFLFQYMCRKCFGQDMTVWFPRKEAPELIRLMSLALSKSKPNVYPLVDYIQNRIR